MKLTSNQAKIIAEQVDNLGKAYNELLQTEELNTKALLALLEARRLLFIQLDSYMDSIFKKAA